MIGPAGLPLGGRPIFCCRRTEAGGVKKGTGRR